MKQKKTRLTADQDLILGKVSIWEKVCYAAGEFGQNILMMLGSTFGTLYFLEVGGLNELILANLLIVCKIIDSLTDIGLGFLFDRYKLRFSSKWKNGGEYRGWLAVMMPLAILAYVIMFNLPLSAPMYIIYACYILSSILQGIGMSGTNIAHGILMTRMTQNPKERNTISMLMAVGVMVATMIVQSLIPAFLPSSNEGDANYIPQGTAEYVTAAQHGYTLAVVICCILFVVSTILVIVFTKERLCVHPDKKAESKNYSLKDMAHFVTSNRPLMIMVIVGICTTVANTLTNTTQSLWMKYYFGDLSKMWILTMFNGFCIMPTIFITPLLCNKFGKKNTYTFGLLLVGIFSMLRYVVQPGNMIMATLMLAPGGVGTGLFLSIGSSIGSDSQDYVEWKNGIRVDGLTSSINTFIHKVLATFVSAIPLYLLAFTGYDAALSQQPASAVQGIHVVFSIAPGALYLIAALVFWKLYPLDNKTLHRMLDELRESRAASQKQ